MVVVVVVVVVAAEGICFEPVDSRLHRGVVVVVWRRREHYSQGIRGLFSRSRRFVEFKPSTRKINSAYCGLVQEKNCRES